MKLDLQAVVHAYWKRHMDSPDDVLVGDNTQTMIIGAARARPDFQYTTCRKLTPE